MKKVLFMAVGLGLFGCGGGSAPEGSAVEVATSLVSGALNNGGGAVVGWNTYQPRRSAVRRILDELWPVGTAWAANWSCSGATLTPTFFGPGNYTWIPMSCSITWANGKTASSLWNGTFALNYTLACDTTHPNIDDQTASCQVTRTTAQGGATRTITGPNGGQYAVTHDTHAAGTGWDNTVTPSPNSSGVVLQCSTGGCALGKGLILNGSHLTGSLTPAGSSTPTQVWDHTVTGQLNVGGSGVGRVVTGALTVQHNLIHETATVSFNSVGYGEAGCCFPTTGSLTATLNSGPNQGKTESLVFSSACGESSYTDAAGTTRNLTLQHCL